MKEYKLNWYAISMAAILVIALIGLLIYGVYGYITYKTDPNEAQEGYQRTIEYISFDGKKHKAIVINAHHDWILVEKQ